MRNKVMEDLRATFRPEFLNRLDEVVLFRSLSREDIEGIVNIQMAVLEARLRERGIALELDEGARRFLAEAGYDPVYGARPLKRAIQRTLENPLAREILAGRFGSGQTIRARHDGEALVFEAEAEVVIK
jgi:ATP-dependent Clp protease ATP-binding subunit ClpB